MSLLSSIGSSLSGLSIAQRSMEAVSNNVSNASNPDFVRQSVIVTARPGGGAEISQIERYVDRFLASKLLSSRSALADARSEADFRQRIEDIVAGGDEAGRLDGLLAGLRADVARAAASPSDEVLRRAVVVSADRLARKLNEVGTRLAELQRELDARYRDHASELSTMLGSLEVVNKTIVNDAFDSGALRNLEDRRDAIISGIADLLPISRFELPSRDVAIYAGQGRPLFDRGVATIATRLESGRTTLLLNGEPIDREIRGGVLGALRSMRDMVLPDLVVGLDEIAAEVASAVNGAHNQAISSSGRERWVSAYAASGFQPVDLGNVKLALRDSTGRVVTQLEFPPGTVVSNRAELTAALEARTDPDGVPYITVGDLGGRITISVAQTSRARGLKLDILSSGAAPSLKQALHLDDVFIGAAGAASIDFTVMDARNQGEPPLAVLRVAAPASRLATLVGREIAVTSGDGSGLRLMRVTAWDPATETATLDGPWRGDPPAAGTRLRPFVPSAATIAVRADLLADPSMLATGWADAQDIEPGSLIGGKGDGRGLDRLAAALDATRVVVGDPQQRMSEPARMIRDRLATAAAANAQAQGERGEVEAVQDALAQQFSSLSGVNIDEEMAQLILLQNAYAASARVLSTVGDLFQRLMQI